MTDTPVLKVENLTKSYGKKKAVSNVSFTVRRSELIGFLGPNGAGKSTTMRMIAGSLALSCGSISVMGYNISEQPRLAKSLIGYLPEVPPLYPEMTVKEYLRFACDLKNNTIKKGNAAGMDADWVDSLIKDFKIENHMSVLIRNLSKGYRQRVGLVAAMAGKPALLLLDEPASGLDPRQIMELRFVLKRISEYMAIIVSSHGLHEIASFCSRIIIMNRGRIVADGQPDELAAGTSLEDVFINLTDIEES